MAIKTSDLNAKLFGKTNKRRATTPVEAQKAAKSQAQVIELAVAGEVIRNTLSFFLMSLTHISRFLYMNVVKKCMQCWLVVMWLTKKN
jgi:hypothetical protein